MGSKLYVGNLHFDATEGALRACFAECGEVAELRIVTDRDTGRSRGFAFVTMKTDADATVAMARLNGLMLDGRPLRVNAAEERPAQRPDRNSRGGHRGW